MSSYRDPAPCTDCALKDDKIYELQDEIKKYKFSGKKEKHENYMAGSIVAGLIILTIFGFFTAVTSCNDTEAINAFYRNETPDPHCNQKAEICNTQQKAREYMKFAFPSSAKNARYMCNEKCCKVRIGEPGMLEFYSTNLTCRNNVCEKVDSCIH